MTSLRDQVYSHMLRELRRDCVPAHLVDCAVLAENSAHGFECEVWLDDPEHWIWPLAIRACAEFGEDYKGV